MRSSKTRDLVQIALFAAILCIVAPFSIPIGDVPISLTNLIIYFSVYLIGWKRGTASYIIYMLLGAVGLPVFSGHTGGIAKLVGPTGGYIIGFILMAIISGIVIEKFNNIAVRALGMLAGLIVTYLFGTVWLAIGLGRGFTEALAIGVLPFIVVDIAKIVVVALVGQPVRNRINVALNI
jgi:biotin transport system substrate-specific component